MRNSERYPDCWAFFLEYARNMENEEEVIFGKYRISKPDQIGDFIYHDRVEILFQLLVIEWYKPAINSPSVYGKIQYIVETF